MYISQLSLTYATRFLSICVKTVWLGPRTDATSSSGSIEKPMKDWGTRTVVPGDEGSSVTDRATGGVAVTAWLEVARRDQRTRSPQVQDCPILPALCPLLLTTVLIRPLRPSPHKVGEHSSTCYSKGIDRSEAFSDRSEAFMCSPPICCVPLKSDRAAAASGQIPSRQNCLVGLLHTNITIKEAAVTGWCWQVPRR